MQPVDLGTSAALRWSLLAGARCNDARLAEDAGRWDVVGDPTEGALLVVAEKAGLDLAALRTESPRISTIPFSSDRQYMATLHPTGEGEGLVVLAKGSATVGIGMGQVNRVDSCRLAVERAGDRAAGSVAASDAFFPFADGPQILLDAGISAIIQPGGSVRDDEVIAAAQAANVTMFFTGERHFFH